MPASAHNLARRSLATLLSQPATYGSVAFIGLCDLFEPEWLQWDPKTVQLEIKDELGVIIEPDMFDKVMAARQVVTSDNYLKELPAFITIANALNGDGVDTPVAQPIDPADLCWAVLEMALLYPPSLSETFSDEIIGYIEESLKWQGVRGTPHILTTVIPEQKFNELQANDPSVMEGIFQRVVDINEEVQANLDAWKYQFKQLKLVNGKTDWVEEQVKTAGALMMSVTQITISAPKGKKKSKEDKEEKMEDFIEGIGELLPQDIKDIIPDDIYKLLTEEND